MRDWTRYGHSVSFLALSSAMAIGAIAGESRVPAPVLPAPTTLPEAGVSFVRIPVRLPVEALRADLEQRIPPNVVPAVDFAPYEKDLQVRYAIQRDSVSATLDQNAIEFQSKLLYWLETRGPEVESARCGSASEPIAVRAAWNVRCGWQDGWRLDTRTTVRPTAFSLRCKPVPPAVNFTAFLNRKIDERVVLPVATALDSMLQAKVQVRPLLEAAWRSLTEPIDLGGAGWLAWHPESVTAEPFQSEGGALVSQLAIVARPRVTAGERPPVTPPPLPETKVRLSGEHVLVSMKFEVPLEDVQAKLGRVAPAGAKMHVTGSGARVAITCEMTDATAVPLYLVGDLEYDPSVYRLAVRGLDYTPESRAAHVATVSSGSEKALDLRKLRDDVEAALSFDLGVRVSTGLILLGKGMNRQLASGVSMRGGAMEQKVLATYVTDTAFGLRLAARGQATLQVE